MNADELAEFPGLDHRGNALDQGVPAQGEADAGTDAGGHGGHVHLAGLHGVERDGFLHKDVLAGLDARHRLLIVLVVGRGDDHGVNGRIGQQGVLVRVDGGNAVGGGDGGSALLVGTGDGGDAGAGNLAETGQVGGGMKP